MKQYVVQLRVQSIRRPLFNDKDDSSTSLMNYSILSEEKLHDHGQINDNLNRLSKDELLLVIDKIRQDKDLNNFVYKINLLSSESKSNIFIKYYEAFPEKIFNLSSLPINKIFFSRIIQKSKDLIISFIEKNVGIEELSTFSETLFESLIEHGISLKQFNFLDTNFSLIPDIQFTKLIQLTSLIFTPENESNVLNECIKMIEFNRKKIIKLLIEYKIFPIDFYSKINKSGYLPKEYQKLLGNILDVKKSDGNNTNDLSQGFINIKICITGTLSKPRSYYETLLIEFGAILQETVNSQTNLLITNSPNSNSSKIINARKFGTKIIDENELLNLLNNQGVTKNA